MKNKSKRIPLLKWLFIYTTLFIFLIVMVIINDIGLSISANYDYSTFNNSNQNQGCEDDVSTMLFKNKLEGSGLVCNSPYINIDISRVMILHSLRELCFYTPNMTLFNPHNKSSYINLVASKFIISYNPSESYYLIFAKPKDYDKVKVLPDPLHDDFDPNLKVSKSNILYNPDDNYYYLTFSLTKVNSDSQINDDYNYYKGISDNEPYEFSNYLNNKWNIYLMDLDINKRFPVVQYSDDNDLELEYESIIRRFSLYKFIGSSGTVAILFKEKQNKPLTKLLPFLEFNRKDSLVLEITDINNNIIAKSKPFNIESFETGTEEYNNYYSISLPDGWFTKSIFLGNDVREDGMYPYVEIYNKNKKVFTVGTPIITCAQRDDCYLSQILRFPDSDPENIQYLYKKALGLYNYSDETKSRFLEKPHIVDINNYYYTHLLGVYMHVFKDKVYDTDGWILKSTKSFKWIIIGSNSNKVFKYDCLSGYYHVIWSHMDNKESINEPLFNKDHEILAYHLGDDITDEDVKVLVNILPTLKFKPKANELPGFNE